MKKFKKNFSKTIFSSFFVFQFIVTTSFMPMVARAEEEVKGETPAAEVSSEVEVSEPEEVTFDQTEESVTDQTLIEDVSDSETSLGDAIKDVVTNVIDSVLGVTDTREESIEVLSGIPLTAHIKVCKVVIGEDGEIVSDWTLKYPGATFSTNLTLQNSNNSFSFDTSGDIEYSDEYDFVTVCESVTMPVDLTEEGLISLTYSEESTSGDYVWEKNYFEGDAQGETGLYNSQGGEMFSTFTLDDTAYDGNLGLNGNPNTEFSATLFLVNKFISGGECDAPAVYARVTLANLENSGVLKTNNGWYNTGNGNMAPKVFVGGTNDSPNEVGGDVYDVGEWFPIYDSTNGYVNDPVLTAVDPGVNGLAVQRLDGQLRVVLYGSHQQPQGYPLTNREMANGFVEFSNDGVTVSSDVVITNQIADAVNPPEINSSTPGGYTGNPTDWPNRDAIWFNSTKSFFKFVVNTHNDGMYTVFTHTLPGEDCGGDPTNQAPIITVNPNPVCLLVTETEESYDLLSGVSANDAEDGNITSSVVVTNHNVHFGFEGIYFVDYSVIDSDGAAAEATKTIFIKKNCGGGGEGGSCASTANLFTNSGFETPTIANTNGWAIYPDGTSGLAWDVQWQAGSGDNTPAKAELQTIYTAHTGDQYLELDSDFDGPGGSISNEAASTRISQTITTVPGQEYEISYYYSARPGYGYDENKVGLYIDGYAWDLSTTTNGVGDTDTQWFLKVNHFTADSTSHTITFADLGTPNSYGMFLDDIKVTCVDDDGGKNTPPTITVNPETACILQDVTKPEFNFLEGVTATDDEDGTLIPSYTHTIVFGTNGTYTITYTVTDSGGLTDTATRTITIDDDCDNGGGGDNDPSLTFPDQSCILTSATSYDFMAGVTVSDDEGVGQVTVTNDGATVVIFGTAASYTVTYIATDSDGNSQTFTRTITISENCGGTGGGDDDDPTITVPGDACYETNSVDSFDFLDGVSAIDFTGDVLVLNLIDNVTGEELVDFTVVGQYQVTYTVTDPFGTATITRTITISDDCDNGGGGGGGNGGGGSSSGSRSSQGEVLGAASCVQFTTYNRVGNTGGEIKALQVFLNEYMDAGLTTDGVYGRTTAQAVHEFQAFHWKEVIDPWTPPLSPSTTGWEYKSTRATINTIIDCPEAPVYLEDSMIMYSVTEVEGEKTFTEEQIAKVAELLMEAQGGVEGASTTFEGK